MNMHNNTDFKQVLIDLQENGFMVKEHEFAGETVYLINPQHIGCTWTEETMIYRSSVWNKDGKAISLSWKKFFNFGEQPQLVPDPTDLNGSVVMDKRDGSTLICSMYKGEWMIRTRGTVDATNLANGHEIEFLKTKYPDFFNASVGAYLEHYEISAVFEWETPNNRIVLNNCDEPQIVLTGVILHFDYSYEDQMGVDMIARTWGVPRPIRHRYDTLDELLEGLRSSSGIEGGCLYFDDGQQIKKIKSVEYLKLHAFKFNMAGSYKPLCEYVVNQRTSDIGVLKQHIVDTYDFECWEFIEEKVTNVVNAFNEMLNEITACYGSIRDIKEQKDFALAVMQKYKSFSPYMFTMRKKDMNIPDELLEDDRMCSKFASDLGEILGEQDAV